MLCFFFLFSLLLFIYCCLLFEFIAEFIVVVVVIVFSEVTVIVNSRDLKSIKQSLDEYPRLPNSDIEFNTFEVHDSDEIDDDETPCTIAHAFSKKWLKNDPQFSLYFLIHIDVLMLCRKFELILNKIY